MDMLVQIVLIVVGFLLLVKGADWFVEGSSGVASRFGIPQIVIGLTIVAMGTSAPEAGVSISSALKGNAGITIGNIVGSNILNVLIILGISSSIVAIKVAKSTVCAEIPFMIAITVLLLLFGYTDNSIAIWEAIVLLILFVSYLACLFVVAKRDKNNEVDEVTANHSIIKLIVLILIGFVCIVWGSNIVVDSATAIAKIIGISERFIGLTIVAFGTSLPELVTSVSAARKGKADIAIGNIVGSNIFNILFIVGLTAVITTVPFEPKFMVDTIVAILSAAMLWVFVMKKRSLNRTHGIAMIVAYVLYFIYLLM